MKILARLLILIIVLTAFSSLSFSASFYDIQFPTGEETIIRNFMGNGTTAKTVNTIEKRGTNYLISILEDNGDTTKIMIRSEDLTPLFHKKVSKKGELKKFVEYFKDGKIDVRLFDKKIKKLMTTKEPAYDMSSLFYLFRCFPFKSKDKIIFELAFSDPGNIRVVSMYVKYLGVEEVSSLAGKFRCHKLEMGCSKVVDSLIWPYKYYFWFSDDTYRHFVKYEGREIDLSITTNQLESYRIGNKIKIKKRAEEDEHSINKEPKS